MADINVAYDTRIKGFTCDASTLIVSRGDSVTWKSPGNFAIRFVGLSPVDSQAGTKEAVFFQDEEPDGRGGRQVTRTIAPGAALGTYEYTVGLSYDAGAKVYVEASPSLIINR